MEGNPTLGQQFTGAPGTTPRTMSAHADAEFIAGLLQATLTARKVTSIVALAWAGPQINAYTVSLGLGEQPERVEALAGALALAAGAESCRVARAEGKLLLELPKPLAERRPLHAHRLEALAAPTPTAVPLGVTTGGKALWCDLADERFCHLVIGGTTGSGKSLLARWLLYRVLRQNGPAELRLLLVDPKRFEFAHFAHAPHLLHPVTSQPLEIARVLRWVGAELDRRAETGRKLPRIIVCVEEVADILSANHSVGGLLARIAQIGRALGIHAIVTTQQPGSRSLGDSLVNFPARLLGRVASATLTYGAAGREKTGAHALLGRGDFLLLAAGETTRFQAPLVDGRQYSQIPRGPMVASLDAELPHLVEFADLARDPRGGRGRRELSTDDYAAITAALRAGATADDLRGAFGIGWERARRLRASYEEEG